MNISLIRWTVCPRQYDYNVWMQWILISRILEMVPVEAHTFCKYDVLAEHGLLFYGSPLWAAPQDKAFIVLCLCAKLALLFCFLAALLDSTFPHLSLHGYPTFCWVLPLGYETFIDKREDAWYIHLWRGSSIRKTYSLGGKSKIAMKSLWDLLSCFPQIGNGENKTREALCQKKSLKNRLGSIKLVVWGFLQEVK